MALVSDTFFSALVIVSGLLGVSTFGFAVAWLRARERAIRAEERAAPQAPTGDARVDRLEHAVAAMADEVQRMAEGQRFVSKILLERAGQEPVAEARAQRVVTPR